MSSKSLIIYFSHENNTKLIAETIAETIGCQIQRITPKEEISRSFFKYFTGGYQAMFKKKPEIESFEHDPMNFDNLIIGSPVWAGTHAPPIHTFLEGNNINGKKIALFTCCDGGPGHAINDMKILLPGNEIISENIFTKVNSNKETSIEQARNWINSIKF